MSVAKTIEISATSPESFEHATKSGIEKACQSLDGVKGAWIKEMKVDIENGSVTHYRVNMKLTFVLKDQPAG